MKFFFEDIASFVKLLTLKNKIKYCFFVENKFLYQYLEPFIKKKKKQELIIVSFDDLTIDKNMNLLVFKTLFFQSLFFSIHSFKIFFTSTPNLNESIYRKSRYKKIKYIYIQHSPLSLTRIYTNGAFINFDVVQAINSFQVKELKEMNAHYSKKIKIYKSPYFFIKNKKKNGIHENIKKKILVAPTWSTNFYKINMHEKIFDILKSNNLDFVFRPHPMSIKNGETSINFYRNKNINIDLNPNLEITNYTDLISDWSGIFIEFAYLNKKFPILINTSQKIRNKDSYNYKTIPLEIYARDNISYNINTDKTDDIMKILNKKDLSNESKLIDDFFEKYFF